MLPWCHIFPVVRTDSLKGRRGRLPSKPKAIQELTSTVSPVSMIASLVRAHIDSNPSTGKLDYSKVKNKTKSSPWVILFVAGILVTEGVCLSVYLSVFFCAKFQYQDTVVCVSEKEDASDIQQFYDLLTASMEVIRKWATSIPGFPEFCAEDQELLLESAFVELFILRLAYWWEWLSKPFQWSSAVVIHNMQFYSVWSHESILCTSFKGPIPRQTSWSSVMGLCFIRCSVSEALGTGLTPSWSFLKAFIAWSLTFPPSPVSQPWSSSLVSVSITHPMQLWNAACVKVSQPPPDLDQPDKNSQRQHNPLNWYFHHHYFQLF